MPSHIGASGGAVQSGRQLAAHSPPPLINPSDISLGNQLEQPPPHTPAAHTAAVSSGTTPSKASASERTTAQHAVVPSGATESNEKKAKKKQKEKDAREAAEERRRVKEEKARERRRRHEEAEVARRLKHDAASRRVIPTPPHRQLFLVDGYYCGADPSGLQQQQRQQQQQQPSSHTSQQGQLESLLTQERRDGQDAHGGGGGVSRPGAAPAALTNRAGAAPGAAPSPSLLGESQGTKHDSEAPLHVSPNVPPTYQKSVTGGVQSSSAAAAPAASFSRAPPAASPVPSESNADMNVALAPGDRSSDRHRSRKVEKLRVKRRFYEPVELQVESMPAFAMRLTLFLWYACLITALVLEVIPRVQWSMVNVCGDDYPVNFRHVERWTSPCVTTTATSSTGSTLTWQARNWDRGHAKLVRFRRIIVSLLVPENQAGRVEYYAVVANATMGSSGVTWAYDYPLTLRCDKNNLRCDLARVPEDALAAASSSDFFHFSLTSLPAALAESASRGAVGLAYQRSQYTLATVIWRYVLMLLSVLHTMRFVAYRKYTSTLYEQSWTLCLQVALLWYLDPLYALNIVSWPFPSVLAFLEYRIPTYFIAVLVAYMMSVMTASMAWSSPDTKTPPTSVFGKLKAFLLRSRNVYDPPMWTKVIICLYLISVFVLDIIDACLSGADWYIASDSDVHFARLHWAVIALLLFGGLVCLVMLVYLRNYLGSKPYLESRPQQLACRVFLMIFLFSVIYYIIHCLVFYLLYNRTYTVFASQQPFLQLPTLMVASFFVNIMTLVYTSQNRDNNVPINPKDVRWKHIVWPDTWYRWLARHGGSQYIFATESEETRFYRLQFEFRMRQYMAKQKRKRGSGGGGGEGGNDSEPLDRSLMSASGAMLTTSGLGGTTFENTQSRLPSMLGQRFANRNANATWRTDVWETPTVSRVSSATDNEEDSEADGNGGTSVSASTADVGAGSANIISASRNTSGAFVATSSGGAFDRNGPAVTSKKVNRSGCGDPSSGVRNPSGPLGNSDAFGGTFYGYNNGSSGGWSVSTNPRGRTKSNTVSGGGRQDYNMPIALAARGILNMDRFSTYFLPEISESGTTGPLLSTVNSHSFTAGQPTLGSNATFLGGSHGSAPSSPMRTPQRENTVAGSGDAFEVEGPARRRTRRLVNNNASSNSALRRRDTSLLRRQEHSWNGATGGGAALLKNQTFSAFEAPPLLQQENGSSSQFGFGIRGSGGYRHARSRSEGDVPRDASADRGSRNSNNKDNHASAAQQDTEKKTAAPALPKSPQRQPQRHADPMAGLHVSMPTNADRRPPSALNSSFASPSSPRSPPSSHSKQDGQGSIAKDEAAVVKRQSRGFSESSSSLSDTATSGNRTRQQNKSLLQALQGIQKMASAPTKECNRAKMPLLPGSDEQEQQAPPQLPRFVATPLLPPTHRRSRERSGSRRSSSPRSSMTPAAVYPQLPENTTETLERSKRRTRSSPSSVLSEEDMATDLSPLTTDAETEADGSFSDSGHHRHGRRSRPGLFRTLNRMRERLGAVMEAAEKNLFERPARGFDKLEMQIFDAAYRPFQALQYLPFFNLETAIDCFNISWEAYGVEKSTGDAAIETGIKVHPKNVPKTVVHGVKKLLCGCCPRDGESSQEEDDEEAGVGEDGDQVTVRSTNGTGGESPREQQNNTQNNSQHSSSPAAAATPAVPPSTEGDPKEMQTHQNTVATASSHASKRGGPSDAHKSHSMSSHHDKDDDAVVLVHMKGEGQQHDNPGPQLSPERQEKQNCLESAGDNVTAASRTPASNPCSLSGTPSSPAVATDPNMFPINAEKYGFTLLLVAEAKEVQVIMVKMDMSVPEHRGKSPRIIIGFRGTANMSNAKYDMNIHRVVWREMERTEEEDDGNQHSFVGVLSRRASTLDDASSVGSTHLGCAACLRSFVRATSWRPTCHAGFLSIWKTLKPTVMQRLHEVLHDDRDTVYRIFTTGHSLGGALASLSAYSITAVLRRMDYPIPEVTVYTYGQPRIGNRTFQRIYNKAVPRSFRIVNESDMVVSMTMFGGCHVGIEVDVDRNGNFIVKPTEIEKLFPPTTGRGLTVINHLMSNYGISLNAIATRTACPARGLACYTTADPDKLAREQTKEAALKQAQGA